jgi:hypothetical protein
LRKKKEKSIPSKNIINEIINESKMKTETKKRLKLAGLVTAIALGGAVAWSNIGSYFLASNSLEKNEVSCVEAEEQLEKLENSETVLNVLFGRYSTEKAYEHYLENNCKDNYQYLLNFIKKFIY